MRPDTYLLIWLAVTTLGYWVVDRLDRIKALEAENTMLRHQRDMAEWERDIALGRDDARRCHYVRMRDIDIEQLQQENRTLRVIAGERVERRTDT